LRRAGCGFKFRTTGILKFTGILREVLEFCGAQINKKIKTRRSTQHSRLVRSALELLGKLAFDLGVALYDHARAVDDARHARRADVHILAVFVRLDKYRAIVLTAF